MSDIDCPICGRQVAPLESDWRGHTCSPECARIKAIVDVLREVAGISIRRPLTEEGIADVVRWDKATNGCE